MSAGFYFWLDDFPEITIPTTTLSFQLLLLVVVPIGAGMALRALRPAGVEARDRVLRRCSITALVALITFVVWDQWAAVVADLGDLALVAVLFTVIAMAAGWSLAFLTGRPAADRLTYLVEFPCRNLALAVVVAVSILGRPDLIAFAAMLLLVQALVMLTLVALLRRGSA